MAKRCKKCNIAIDDRFCFCPHCGEKLVFYNGQIRNKPPTRSELISFLIFRIQEIQADSRTIYSSFWQKFSLVITFSFAIFSMMLAVGAVFGIEPVVNILKAIITDRAIIPSIVFIFFISIVLPVIVGGINNLKRNEYLVKYEGILRKTFFCNLKDEHEIINLIKKVEEEYSSDLTSYIKGKIKYHISKFKNDMNKFLKIKN